MGSGSFGDEIVDESKVRLSRLTPDQIDQVTNGFDRIHRSLEELHAQGVPVADPRVRDLIAEHHAIVFLAWTPTPETYVNLGRMYVVDERFRKSIGRGNDAMVEYLRDAIAAHADAIC